MTKPDRPTVPEAAERLREYYKHNSMGGVVHIVIEDGNVRNRDVEWCLKEAVTHGGPEDVAIAQMLLQMTTTQRTKLSKMHHYPPL